MRKILTGLVSAMAVAAMPAMAGTTGGEQSFDLLFKTGTLDDLPRDETLVYTRDVTNRYVPDAEERDTGRIALEFVGGEPEGALLKFMQGEKYRNLGKFPASVGNPIIMYFVETVVRDMAESAGGSPFYIRNRVKDALAKPGEMSGEEVTFEGHDIEAKAVTLRPFDGDPNAAAMQGFGDLEITVTMSEEVPGWYHTLEAVVPGTDGAPRYASTMTLASHEEVQ